MAEAEDVIVDAARHATVFARQLWVRHRPNRKPDSLSLAEVTQRLSILIEAIFGLRVPIRIAQRPTPPTFLTRVFRSSDLPRHARAIPATDGSTIWLPGELQSGSFRALSSYRCMALLQATRMARGSASYLSEAGSRGVGDLYLLIEASVAHDQLAQLLPGIATELDSFKAAALSARPGVEAFPAQRRSLEALVQSIMKGELPELKNRFGKAPASTASLDLACTLAMRLSNEAAHKSNARSPMVFKDLWIGELRAPHDRPTERVTAVEASTEDSHAIRSARLARRPEVRAVKEGEDDKQPGAWMIQTAPPQESAEDPLGMQRPTDVDEGTAAEEYADSVSELSEARLVSTPGRAKEILISDDPPEAVTQHVLAEADSGSGLDYPEWDYRIEAYRHPGARIRILPPIAGSLAWVEQTMRQHQTMCEGIKRRFEMLRAERQRVRKQLDGDELDLDAYVDARADLLAGLPMPQAVYQSTRLTRRDLAITLLIDISGSTDSWVSAQRRIVDVEREALLLVCVALEGLREPYSVLAFSGEGKSNVTIRDIKGFNEPFGNEIARRIAALEPEHYTRAGAAIRHATALLLEQPARHRLLLLLSDGRPNDNDEYDGRYGAEDMRQSVTEARLQGIFPFCLTIDRQAATYLPQVFGANHYALLHKPESLPTVLLDWMRRLVVN
jgi:nitric oxide reductase NorD protein